MSGVPLWRRALLRLAGGVPASSRRGVFAGAQINRLTSDFLGSVIGPRTELRYELRTLRSRARDLERNNPWARRYLQLVAENVVGPRGVRLQACVRRTDGTMDAETNARIEQAWQRWGRRETCTVTGRLSWVEVQQMGMRMVARDGETFVRLVEGAPGNAFGFALQLLDADQFDETWSAPAQGGETQTVMSVELDAWDRPVRYWMWSKSPYDSDVGQKKREPLPAASVVHLFRGRRPGQVRGEPWLAPVMVKLKMLDGFTEAALVNARTSAAKMGWITTSPDAPVDDPDTAPRAAAPLEAEPGMISRLAPGESFEAWDPAFPNGEFGAFNNAVLHEIAAGLNVSHASMTGDLSQVNYSSIRAGLITERDHWRSLQGWFAEAFCDVVYRAWLRNAVLTGALRLPSERLADYEAVQWRPRGWSWVDPMKDVQAAALAVAYGFTSRQRVVAEDGEDLDEILAEQAAEHELLEAYDVTLAMPSGVALPTEGTDAGSDDEATDGAGDAVADGRGGARAPRHAGGRGRADSALHLLRAAGGAVVRP